MHAKRIATGSGKGFKWTTASRGPQHDRMPILNILRDRLGYADNAREAKNIIKRGLVMVDKKVQKDHQYGVGFMDVVEIPMVKQHFRILKGAKGLYLKEIGEKESGLKLCRVNGKRMLPKGKTQLNLHDGSNVITGQKTGVNDTLLVELPSLKVKEILPLQKGSHAMVYQGRHAGETGTIKDVQEGTRTKKSITTINELQTLTKYVMVIGKDKPLITI